MEYVWLQHHRFIRISRDYTELIIGFALKQKVINLYSFLIINLKSCECVWLCQVLYTLPNLSNMHNTHLVPN